MTLEEAREDVIDYLKRKNEEYFLERGKIKAIVLADSELMDELAIEHHRCVELYGCNRNWSVKDACDVFPGIMREL